VDSLVDEFLLSISDPFVILLPGFLFISFFTLIFEVWRIPFVQRVLYK
jgi:hypothetical protein